jgi:hypothetical protein
VWAIWLDDGRVSYSNLILQRFDSRLGTYSRFVDIFYHRDIKLRYH